MRSMAREQSLVYPGGVPHPLPVFHYERYHQTLLSAVHVDDASNTPSLGHGKFRHEPL